MSEEKMDNIKELNDEELDKVSGGGYFKRVTDCPYGYTKWVLWLKGHNAGEKCSECNFRKVNEDIFICEKAGNLEWEW